MLIVGLQHEGAASRGGLFDLLFLEHWASQGRPCGSLLLDHSDRA
jgi:hypothetical protein